MVNKVVYIRIARKPYRVLPQISFKRRFKENFYDTKIIV